MKPQFEVAAAEVTGGGVVRSPAAWRGALTRVLDTASNAGVHPVGLMASPVRGPAGNVEFLVHGRMSEADRPLTPGDLDAAIAEGEGVGA